MADTGATVTDTALAPDPASAIATGSVTTTATVHTTAGHPFWNLTTESWTEAAELQPGQLLSSVSLWADAPPGWNGPSARRTANLTSSHEPADTGTNTSGGIDVGTDGGINHGGVGDLTTGSGDPTAGTATVTVAKVRNHTGDTVMHNLTIADTHTYHGAVFNLSWN